MMRNVYFEGEMGDRFIPHLEMEARNVAEVFQCLQGNFPNFKEYIIEKYEEGVGFNIDVAGNELEDPREILLDLKEGDITIMPTPAGAKSGPAKILVAVAITLATAGVGASALAVANASAAMAGTATTAVTFGSALSAGMASFGFLGTMAMGLATNLAITGISEVMAPDPSTDSDQEQSYLFNGAEQNIIEGDPVPILYGRLRVPGQPVSFEIVGAGVTYGSNGTNIPGQGTSSNPSMAGSGRK